jgi:hypothetical protein
MTLEGTGGSELTEFVANHVFRYINGNMLAAIMNSNRMTYEVRENRGASGPGLYNFFIVSFVESRDFLHEAFCNERSLFNRS